jgi:hypothetical protein
LKLCLPLVAVMTLLGALTFSQNAPAQPPYSTIQVTFTNETSLPVYFYLNGGSGLNTSLAAGESQNYTMVVDAGGQPVIRIKQPSGQYQSFTVSDGGDYAFRVMQGKIKNCYR